MRPWSRVAPEQYRALELRAHTLLAEVPIHDVWCVFLPDGSRPCTMMEVRAITSAGGASRSRNVAVRSLFAFRRLLGRLFGWDQAHHGSDVSPSRARLTEADIQESLVPPGTRDGSFEVVYVHATEAVSEIRNATVQAFLVWALTPAVDGHNLFWAIHVLPVSAWTPWYMSLIDPFRRWIVYPSLLRHIHEAWIAETDGRA